VTIIVIIVLAVQFWRILILAKRLQWFSFKEKLDQSRVFYPKEHARIMSSGFGRGHDFNMNRHRLQQGEYLIANLEELEKRQDLIEERFNEMHIYLGKQYCYDLDPSLVGFKRCVEHIILEQTRTYLIAGIILFVGDRVWQIISIFIV